MAEILYTLNLSYTIPTYVLAKADKEKQEYFKSYFINNVHDYNLKIKLSIFLI